VKVTSTCVSTATAIYDLKRKYDDAPQTLSSIISETRTIGASLSQIQAVLLGDVDHPLESRPQRSIALSNLRTALAGCELLFACVKGEIQAIPVHPDNGLSKKDKIVVVWNSPRYQELLDHLRGQQAAIGNLIQLLHADSLNEITRLLYQHTLLLQQNLQRTESLRNVHPAVAIPESISDRDHHNCSLLGSDLSSLVSDTRFEFDAELCDSGPYRKLLRPSKRRAHDRNHHVESEKDDCDVTTNGRDHQIEDDQSLMDAVSPGSHSPPCQTVSPKYCNGCSN
jgi:hypothetical protein